MHHIECLKCKNELYFSLEYKIGWMRFLEKEIVVCLRLVYGFIMWRLDIFTFLVLKTMLKLLFLKTVV